MNAIVNVSCSWGIGRGNDLLVRIPEDLKHFRHITLGKTVILGRATLAGFPGGAPLPGRRNIVLSRDPDFRAGDAVVCRNKDEVLKAVSGLNPDEVFVIGGESVYREFLPFCRRIYVTRTETGETADRFFPDLDQMGWRREEESPLMESGGLFYRYITYVNPNL
ncbi:dihydrofolate reductase [Papillibacter cinnamivorans]|uniref:dihydrofolate reductase n=1 Tax=Papillibacter cinnamivorans DSM 12816 TaxID=1122930 RepID=A0A1W2BGY9_9FIRM|nr:dihydrofolate reductase [Papillibacter cinnamivorans]SMC71990.1 dihydrofolate reductase [Papillibacter cinnamivorans DSM 12816]